MTMSESPIKNDGGANDQKHIIRISMIRIGVVIVAFFALFFAFPNRDFWAWQLYGFAISLSLLGFSAGIVIFVARRNRIRTALILSVVALNLNILILGLIFQGIGLTLALILVLTVGALVSISTHKRTSTISLSISLFIGAAVALSDVLLRSYSWRFDTSSNQFISNFGWILTAAVLLANSFFFYRKFINFPLRIKLAVSFLLVTISSLWGLSYINNQITQVLLTEQAQDSLAGAVNQIQSNLQSFLETNQAGIANEAQLPVFEQYLTNTLNPIYKSQALDTLHVLRGRDPEYIISVTIANSNGLVILSTLQKDMGTNISDAVFFSQTTSQNTTTISPVYYYALNDARIYFTAPLVTESGLGALILTYDAAKLQSLLLPANTAVGEQSFAVLFDENFIHIAHSASPEVNYRPITPFDQETYDLLRAENRIAAGSTQGVFMNLPDLRDNLLTVQSNDKELVFFTSEDVATGSLLNEVVAIEIEQDWILAFFQPQAVFLAPAENQLRANALISILITTVVAILAIALSQFLTNPIINLTDAANRISDGDFSIRITAPGKDEFGILATTFNDMSEQLETLVTGLEGQVKERTSELEARSEKLRMAAEIARDTSIETNLNIQLRRAVDLISDRLDLYFVGIYLLDDKKTFGQLMTGSGNAGQMLVESDHRANLRSATPLGFTLTSGEPRLVRENDPTLNLIRHPVLPDLKEQLVLPLKVGYDIIGAIDLQSDEVGALTEADIPVLLIMADQIAVSIQKGKLSKDMENTLEELETAYGRYTQDSWRSFSKDQEKFGYRFQQVDVEPIQENSDEIVFAWEQGEILQHETEGESSLLIPMKVRGQVISVLNITFDTDTIPQDTRLLIEEIGNRLSLVMENARLVESSQKQVEQEQLTSLVTARMRESLDMDTILRTSVEEISKALNIPEIEIQLGRGINNSNNGHSK